MNQLSPEAIYGLYKSGYRGHDLLNILDEKDLRKHCESLSTDDLRKLMLANTRVFNVCKDILGERRQRMRSRSGKFEIESMYRVL